MNATDWTGLALAPAQSGWLALAALAGAIAVILMSLPRLRRITPANAAVQTTHAAQPHADMSEPTPLAKTENAPDYEVGAVDALTEVEVFMQFGQLENAAQALRGYVEHYAGHSRRHLQRLAELYLQLGHIHDYAETLRSLHDQALLDRAQLEDAVLQGLRRDFNNLELRLLAEQRLGLGMADIASALGDGIEEITLQTLAVPEPEPEAAPSGQGSPLTPVALVDGCRPLAALDAMERDIVSSLLPTERQARILLSSQDFRHALPVLETILRLRPGSLSHRLDVLYVHYQQRDLDGYCRTLWQFHLALGPYGARLKQQLVHAGLIIGSHPVLKQLAADPDRPELERIGRQAGYSPLSAPPSKPCLRLVERRAAQGGDDSPDPLREAERYLDYGQVDQATRVLEQAILCRPDDAALYPPLLQLYERLDDLPRFTWLLRRLKDDGRQPPGEITLTLSAFVQAMQERRHRGLAA
ncbi:hypothetical protein BI343_07150 [Chromobacterium amazonense]|uniref:type IV pilus assembly protein FimV n=1 Tax=Chromobacterium amazonense TaxID=1382803 RepID=UPI0008DA503A|nr:hypothetical protein [Chromobacterium amazonense]OHX18501.1 hypothetical protein BI343_07150 [Chromobacterium amazonense]